MPIKECVRVPQAGDVLIVPQTRACLPRHMARGVRVVRYWLATGSYNEWTSRLMNDFRPHPCSGELAHSEAAAARVARVAGCQPRIVHPYLTPTVTSRAVAFMASDWMRNKRNLLVANHDLGRMPVLQSKQHTGSSMTMMELLNDSARAVGGTVVLADGLSQAQLVEAYRAAKAVIGWCMHGSERIPLEASLFGAVLLTNACEHGATAARSTNAPLASRGHSPASIPAATTTLAMARGEAHNDGSDNQAAALPLSALLSPYTPGDAPASSTAEVRHLATWLRSSLADVFGARYVEHVRASAPLRERAQSFTRESNREELRDWLSSSADLEGRGRAANTTACMLRTADDSVGGAVSGHGSPVAHANDSRRARRPPRARRRRAHPPRRAPTLPKAPSSHSEKGNAPSRGGKARSRGGKAASHGSRARSRRTDTAARRAEPYSLWDRENVTRPAIIGNATVRARLYDHLMPLIAPLAQRHAAIVVGAHMFAKDRLDPVAALLRPFRWHGALLIEASPLTAQQLQRDVRERPPLPAASPRPDVVNLGICPSDFDGGLNHSSRFYTLTATGDGLPEWTSQVSSFNRRGVASFFPYLQSQSAKHGHGYWTVRRLDTSVRVHEVECVGLVTALRRHPALPPPLVVTIDVEGLDCRIVASYDWCASDLRPLLLVFEYSHCTTDAFRRAQAALHACQGFASGPAFADKENIYYIWGSAARAWGRGDRPLPSS